MKRVIHYAIIVNLFIVLTACSSDTQDQANKHQAEPDPVIAEADAKIEEVDYSLSYVERLHKTRVYPSAFELGNSQLPRVNNEALVPSMCYTKHEAQYNPCYVCHQDAVKEHGRANKMDDGFLQKKYLFSAYAMKNNWSNMFVDRSAEVSKISDDEIQRYVSQDNYTPLAPMLKRKGFIGYVPDIKNLHLGSDAFESDGFAKDGSHWVAFNYKPLPSTFWPVNGSTDDVLIRLHKDFREDKEGKYSKTIYQFNLAIVEAAVKGLSTISVDNLDEASAGIDLNGDGRLGVVSSITRPEFYVGKAAYMPVETFLYPLYTEFLHSVRYIGSDEEGSIYNAPRMKELRYMVKTKSYADAKVPYTKAVLAGIYDNEWQEKWEGNNAPSFGSLQEKGIDNKMGWRLQGFIEDARGELRPQTYEETFYCMGCHTNLGSTFDQVFSFARKIDGKEGWGYIDLKAMLDVPNRGEDEGEILMYLKRAGGGSEFRIKNDMYMKFYEKNELDVKKVKDAASVYELITPSRKSALRMNKAYRVLVQSQDYLHGREGNPLPVSNVHQEIDKDTETLPVHKVYRWDMRLDWSKN